MRHAASTLLIVIASCLAAPLTRADRPPEPLNILLIISDDFGWADLAANNPGCFYDTPALDRLAREGANLTQAYASSPVCSPSRVSLMTGRYPTRTDTTTWFWTERHRSENFQTAESIDHLPLDQVTIAQVLGENGYRTMHAGKWHLGHGREHWPDRRGFQVSFAGSGAGSPGRQGYFAPFSDAIPDVGEAPEGQHLPALLTDKVIEFLAQDEHRPFFVTLSYYSVHTPLDGPESLIRSYQARADALGLTDQQRFGHEEQVWDRVRESSPTRPVRQRQDHAVYASMVTAMDEQIGRLLTFLDDRGLSADTLVIFTSDHGGLSIAEGSPTSNLPLRAGKGWIYEGGLRVPLLVRWPGVTAAGSTVPTASLNNDLFPTFIDAAGLDIATHAAHTDGHSIRAALASGEELPREPFFWHYPHYSNQGGFPAAAIRLGPWKLIQRLEDGRIHLYNLDADPGEHEDLASSHPKLAEDLAHRLQVWQKQSNVKFLRRRGDGPAPWLPPFADAYDQTHPDR